MLIRRSLVSAFCLLMFGSESLLGQESNPFSAWDRQQPKNGTLRTSQKAPRSDVTYFSPNSEEAESTISAEVTADQKSYVPMRERSGSQLGKSAAKAAKTPAKPVANSAKPTKMPAAIAVTASETKSPGALKLPIPKAKSLHSEDELGWSTDPASAAPAGKSPATARSTSKAHSTKDAGVKHAAFQAVNPSKKGGAVSQVRQQSDESSAETAEDNPFAEFVGSSHKSEETFDSKFAVPDTAAQAEEEEKAEALFGNKPAPKKPAPKAGPATAAPVKQQGPATPPKPAAAKPIAASKEEDGPQSPGVTVQWVRHGEFNVGQECDVDLIVQNTSRAVVRSVMTEAVIPDEVEVVEAVPGPMAGTETPTWTFGELQPGETRKVAMKLIPVQRGDVRLDAIVRLTGYSSSAFTVQEPMIGVAMTGPEKAEVGQQIAYVVRVSNPGTGIASNVVIQAAIPEGLEHRSGSLLSIEIGTLNPGESRQAKLNLTAIKGGAQDIAVRAIADGGLNEETLAAVSIAEPQLSIAISGPTEQMAGRVSDFTMTVSSQGNVQSSNVRAKYRIPEGLEFVSADRGGKYNKESHSIEWFVGNLQPSEASEFQLSLRATEAGEMKHQAGVISEHDQVTMCDYATTVEGIAVLDMKIVASDNDLKKGDEVTWKVRISNSGSRAASNVGMSCELPSGMQLVSADGPAEHIAENGIMVFRSMPSINEGEDAVFTITARCVREGHSRLRLRVASESISEPLIGEESATVVDR